MSKKKIFVVSDIHGHYSILKQALEKAGYDPKNENHFLICCGDYFDRGCENVEVLKFFEKINNCALLRGNHEDLLLELLYTGKVKPHNYINGTMITLENFFGKYSIDPVDDSIDFSGHNRTVDRICDFINGTLNYFETENYVFVHGWIPDECKSANDLKSVNNEQWAKARWIKWTDRYDENKPLIDKTLVCGHMPTFYAKFLDPMRSGSEIFYANGLIAIDAGAYDSKRVNVLVVEDELLAKQ